MKRLLVFVVALLLLVSSAPSLGAASLAETGQAAGKATRAALSETAAPVTTPAARVGAD